jgi:hypothetical protein
MHGDGLHEENTEEENNGYVVLKMKYTNIYGSAGKYVECYSALPRLLPQQAS